MNYDVNERLSKLIFIELNDMSVLERINGDFYKNLLGKDILFPIDLKMMTENKNPKRSDLTMDKFFVGMLLCIGGNDGFIYNNYYEDIILNFENSQEFYKGYIYNLINQGDLFEAYILLRGFSKIYYDCNYKEKLISVLYNLKDKNDFLKSEFKKELDDAMKNYRDFTRVYIYKSMMEKDEGKYMLALESIDRYINFSENVHQDVKDYRNQLVSFKDYEDGKDKIYSSPKEALEKLIPLMDMFKDDALLPYYIAIAYRKLGMYEQAIYYLEISRELDLDIVEVVNELGLNYASIEMYDKAISCFKTVFKVTNAIEVCTNLIMSFYKINDVENMDRYFDLAKKINEDDEVLKELQNVILGTR